MTVAVYGHWVPGEGRAGLEAALAGGARMGAGECKIVPIPVPNLQMNCKRLIGQPSRETTSCSKPRPYAIGSLTYL